MSNPSSLNSLCCILHLRLWVPLITVQDDSFALFLLVRWQRGERVVAIMEIAVQRREEVYLKGVFLWVSTLCTRCFGACCSILLFKFISFLFLCFFSPFGVVTKNTSLKYFLHFSVLYTKRVQKCKELRNCFLTCKVFCWSWSFFFSFFNQAFAFCLPFFLIYKTIINIRALN